MISGDDKNYEAPPLCNFLHSPVTSSLVGQKDSDLKGSNVWNTLNILNSGK
jgi:hypothetical protein